jgi:hypothetical protein
MQIFFAKCRGKTLGIAFFVECLSGDTWQRIYKKIKQYFSSASHGALGKVYFLECQVTVTRQSVFLN